MRIATCEQISTLCATEPRILAPVSPLSLMWKTFVRADDAVMEVTCLSTFVLIEAAWCEFLFF